MDSVCVCVCVCVFIFGIVISVHLDIYPEEGTVSITMDTLYLYGNSTFNVRENFYTIFMVAVWIYILTYSVQVISYALHRTWWFFSNGNNCN